MEKSPTNHLLITLIVPADRTKPQIFSFKRKKAANSQTREEETANMLEYVEYHYEHMCNK